MIKQGVLLVNLGTPEAPTAEKVREYLAEFLMDKWVIDVPFVFRWLLVKTILRKRPQATAALYQKIWTDQGSPLLHYSVDLTEKLKTELGSQYEVALGMRYGKPSLKEALTHLKLAGIDKLTLLPLYPQYSTAATQSSVEAVQSLLKGLAFEVSLKVIPPFFAEKSYIKAFAQMGEGLLKEKKPDHVIFSFHGLPERQIKKTDETGHFCRFSDDCCQTVKRENINCYRAQCFATAFLIAEELKLKKNEFSVSFQSRLGRTPWIKPHTDALYRELPAQGVKKVLVFSPSFVADCLETLEEIAIRGRDEFIQSGGAELTLVPSLNATPVWVKSVAEILRKTI